MVVDVIASGEFKRKFCTEFSASFQCEIGYSAMTAQISDKFRNRTQCY